MSSRAAPAPAPADAPYRAGHAAIAGRPNVGKSTLVNAWLGEHLSIVSPKPQTTRQRIFGICTSARGQVVFVDTPGLVESPRHGLHRAMLLEAEEAMADADVVLYVCAADDPATYPDAAWAAAWRARPAPPLLVVNKSDLLAAGERDALRACLEALGLEVWLVSAREGEGLHALLDRMLAALPASPPLYPLDDLATQPLRFFAEEYVRETCLELFEDEVPHGVACRAEEFREDGDPVYIRMTLYVERPSQKAIVVGAGGEAVRRLGIRSREKIEALIERPVYLDLWVKVLRGWRRHAGRLRDLGFRAPSPNP